jgi:hypothetical protein
MGLAPKKHPFATIISIAILNPRGEVEVCLHACAIFDTGCPSNLMSTEFADRAAHNLKKKYGEGSLIGLGGGTFNSIGVVEGRFHIGENKFTTMGGRLVDDPKMYAASFEVSDRTQRFDVIIGSKTISQYQLLVWNPPAAYPVAKSFRSAHATQDTHSKKLSSIAARHAYI